MTIKVLVDSSFLFLPLNCKIDISQETERVTQTKVEFILADPIYNEIENIAAKSNKPTLKKKAKSAFQALKT